MARSNHNNSSVEWFVKIQSNQCLLIILCAIVIGISVSLTVTSQHISARFAKNNQTTKDALKINILVLTSLTLILSSMGIMGALTQCYRLIRYFTLLSAINTVFSLYIAIKYVSIGLIVLSLFTVLILLIAINYEKSLKQLNSNNDNVMNNSSNNSNNQISVITTSSSSHSIYPPQYEPPPAYSDLADLPKIVV